MRLNVDLIALMNLFSHINRAGAVEGVNIKKKLLTHLATLIFLPALTHHCY